MEILVVAALAVAGAVIVARPIVRGVASPDVDPDREELHMRKRAALEALIDIESEHAVGKLSDADYEQLQATYGAEALAVLDEIDAAARPEADDELEGEIAVVRARLARGTCPRCGSPRASGSRCPRCGA